MGLTQIRKYCGSLSEVVVKTKSLGRINTYQSEGGASTDENHSFETKSVPIL